MKVSNQVRKGAFQLSDSFDANIVFQIRIIQVNTVTSKFIVAHIGLPEKGCRLSADRRYLS
jgi:hypothetical protein